MSWNLAGIFRIGSSSLNGCGSVEFSQEYDFGVPRNVSIETSDALVQCVGNQVELQATGTENIYSFVWYNSKNEAISIEKNLSLTLNATDHSFKLVGRTMEGCMVEDQINFQLVGANDLPKDPSFTLDEKGQLQLHMNNISSVENTYYWQDSALGTSTEESAPVRTITEGGYYYLRAINRV